MTKKFSILLVLGIWLMLSQSVLAVSNGTPDSNTPPVAKSDTTVTTPKNNTPEEQAVYNIDSGQLPILVDQTPPDTSSNIFSGIAGAIGSLFSSIGALFNPTHPDQLVNQSSKSTQVIVPDQIKQEIDQKNPDDRTKAYFGKSTGVYGAQLPDIQDQKDTVGDYEQTYEQANFPDGVHPITRQ